MKTLLLMRHAKSSWKDTELEDLKRPLNKRGEKDAPRMGRVLKEEDLLPQLILSSPAERTRQTVELFSGPAGYRGDVKFVDTFYMGEPPVFFKAVQALPDSLDRVMLVGHNPGMEETLLMLTGEAEGMPTGAIAHISLPIRHWKELSSETRGELVKVWRPRDLE